MMSSDLTNDLLADIPPQLHETLQKYWQDWCESCEQHSVKLIPAGLELEELLHVWACSDFIARYVIRYPLVLNELVSSGDLLRDFTPLDYINVVTAVCDSARQDDRLLMQKIRHLRHRQMVRIAWRDLTAESFTTQTLKELSWMADAFVSVVLEQCYNELCESIGIPYTSDGRQQRLLVIGMGKLGAYELNYSSDIDLIFAYAEQGEIEGKRQLAVSEFFTRLAQRLIRLLNENTVDGFVFRVDTRLRPYGDSGPLVMSFSGLEAYYQTQGRSWERYAMIKARAMAGDAEDVAQLTEILKPFVYRRYLDFGAFSSIRKMKILIENEIRRKSMQHNIKLGEGGIREIEFIGQAFQLIRGGREPELQIRGIVDVLNHLAKSNDMPQSAVDQLLESYAFLRKLENRLQMYADQQTHILPVDELLQIRIAYAMDFDCWDELLKATNSIRQKVHGHFQQVFAAPQIAGENESRESESQQETDFQQLWAGGQDLEMLSASLASAGFDQPDEVAVLLDKFQKSKNVTHLSDISLRRLSRLMPMLLAALVNVANSATVLRRLLQVIQAVLRRSVYVALLYEYPMALSQLIRLCDGSQLVTELLSKYPLLLDDLLNPSELYAPIDPLSMEQELDIESSRYDDDDLEQQMDVLRHFKQSQILKIAAKDISGAMDVFDISSQLTRVAELILHRVYQMAWLDMVEKHGTPRAVINGETVSPQLLIVAYGKLGGKEFAYGSDLDIVFLHNSEGEQQVTDGEKSVDNAVFFARMTQRIIHILSSYTAAGRLYEVDTRLRPDGSKGLLVSSFSSFEKYQLEQAWTWEHQALLRARTVVADTQSMHEFDRIRQAVLVQPRDEQKLKSDVRDMRQKMHEHLGSKSDEAFNIKQDAGGLVDIEFMVQFEVLSQLAAHPQLLAYSSTIEWIEELANIGVWDRERAETLVSCYRHYRHLAHQKVLQDQPANIDLDETVLQEQQKVRQIWQDLME